MQNLSPTTLLKKSTAAFLVAATLIVILSACGTAPAQSTADPSEADGITGGDANGASTEEPDSALAELTVVGTESSACAPMTLVVEYDQAVEENRVYGDPTPYVEFGELTFDDVVGDPDVPGEDILLDALNAEFIDLTDETGETLNATVGLDEVMTERLAEGTPSIGFHVASEELDLGDYVLVFHPGAFGCVGGSTNAAQYSIPFTVTAHYALEAPEDCPEGSDCSLERIQIE